jgi:D-aminopeptidase
VRARDLGLGFGLREPGVANAITDVPGVAVGHANAAPDHTGVTAVLPGLDRDAFLEPYPAGAAILNGAGEIAGLAQIEEWGLAETPIFLTATAYVGAVYDAATRVLQAGQPRIGVDDVIIPVVAECDPSSFCDVRDGHRPDPALVRRALAGAAGGAVAEGQVGAGVGMSCCGYAAGIGTSSRRAGEHVVGVLVLANFGETRELRLGGHLVGPALEAPAEPGREGSCVCIVATDAPLLASDLARLARRTGLGLARVGSYASNGSGEVAVAFSTAQPHAYARDRDDGPVALAVLAHGALNPLFAACVEATEEAVANALCAGRTLHGATGATLEALPLERVRALVAASR